MTQDKIIERVQKLLNLAGNNPSETERDAAMKKALAILAEHNMTMEQVEKTTTRRERDVGHMTANGRSGPWIKGTYAAIGRLYFCEYVFMSLGKRTVHYFIGEQANCAVAHQIAAWVSEALWKEGMAGKRRTGSNNTYLTSFLNHASDVLLARVDQMIREARKGETVVDGKNLPVLASLYDTSYEENVDYIEKALKPKKVRTRKTVQDAMGAMHGAEAARRINLRPQVGKQEQEKLP